MGRGHEEDGMTDVGDPEIDRLERRIAVLEGHRKQWRSIASEAIRHLQEAKGVTSRAVEFLARHGSETNGKPEGG